MLAFIFFHVSNEQFVGILPISGANKKPNEICGYQTPPRRYAPVLSQRSLEARRWRWCRDSDPFVKAEISWFNPNKNTTP